MSVTLQKSNRSLFGTGCLYLAAYLSIAAAALFAHEAALWYRTGRWMAQDVSTVLIWLGLRQPPAVGWSPAQLLIDEAWVEIADSPLAVAVAVLALIAAFAGALCNIRSSPGGGFRRAS